MKTVGNVLNKSPYLDPKWQQLRLLVMNRDNFSCVLCGSKDKTFNVHHKVYKKGYKVFQYNLKDLVTLCDQCHDKHHKQEGSLNKKISGAFEYLLWDNRNKSVLMSSLVTIGFVSQFIDFTQNFVLKNFEEIGANED